MTMTQAETYMVTLREVGVKVEDPIAGPDTRILLVPWGEVESTSGNFITDAESARMVLAAFVRQGVDLPIDYEHQTLGGQYGSPSGLAPAAGWITALEVVEGEGIYGQVRWTPRGEEALTNREYRYLSPVAIVRKDDQRMVELHSVGLTNKPAIRQMQPIVSKQDMEVVIMPQQGGGVDAGAGGGNGDGRRDPGQSGDAKASLQEMNEEELLEKLRSTLKLSEEANVKAILIAAIEALTEDKAEANKAITKIANAAGLPQANAEQIAQLLAATDERSPNAIVQLKGQVEALQHQLDAHEVDAVIAKAVAEGKVAPNEEDWAKTLALSNRQSFDEWLQTQSDKRPAQGKTGQPGGDAKPDRQAIINKARTEFEAADPKLRMSDVTAWVNDSLRQADKATLSDEEKKTLVA